MHLLHSIVRQGVGRQTVRAFIVLVLSLTATTAFSATRILFIGNSFITGYPDHHSFGSDTVKDLNATGYGGVPSVFKAFTVRAGLDYDVSLEAVHGSNLDLHYNTKLPVIAQAWDKVVIHGHSTLDENAPGNPEKIITYLGLLAENIHTWNPQTEISLMATWARADQVYPHTGAWYGKTVGNMARDIQASYEQAQATHASRISRVIPVGLTWNYAMDRGVADNNPYNGLTVGQLNLWNTDNYHASRHGMYLEALTLLYVITGIDPRTMGRDDPVAAKIGVGQAEAEILQNTAWQAINSGIAEARFIHR